MSKLDSADVHCGFTLVHMDIGDYQDAVRITIKVELTERGWDRHDLADRSGLTYVTVGRILRSERDVTMPYLISLARAFGWTAGELLTRAEDRMRTQGYDVPGGPGIHPEDAALVDSSPHLTKSQREKVKEQLSGENSDDTPMTGQQPPSDSVDSSARRRRRVSNG